MKRSFFQNLAIGSFIVGTGALMFIGCGEGGGGGTIQNQGFQLGLQEIEFMSPTNGQPDVCTWPMFSVKFKNQQACRTTDISQMAAVFAENPANPLPLGSSFPIQDPGTNSCIYNFYALSALPSRSTMHLGIYQRPGTTDKTILNNTISFVTRDLNDQYCASLNPTSVELVEGLVAEPIRSANIGDAGQINPVTGEVTFNENALRSSFSGAALALGQAFFNNLLGTGNTPRHQSFTIQFNRPMRVSSVQAAVRVYKLNFDTSALSLIEGYTVAPVPGTNNTFTVTPETDGWEPNTGGNSGYTNFLVINKSARGMNAVPMSETPWVPFNVR